MTSVGDGGSGPLAQMAYDRVGQLTSRALSNGLTVNYGYDTLNRLTSVADMQGGTTLASYQYQLGPAGNRLSATETNSSGTSITQWTYDDVYRILSETRCLNSCPITSAPSNLMVPSTLTPPPAGSAGSGGSAPSTPGFSGPIDMLPGDPSEAHLLPKSADPVAALQAGATPTSTSTPSSGTSVTWKTGYTYDPVGNRLTQTANNVVTSSAYNALDQLTQASSSAQLAQYTYNGRGDLAFSSVQPTGGASTVSTYTWDARDRMTGVTIAGQNVAAMTYDDGGHRVQTTFNGQVTNYLWDGLSAYGDVALETDSTGAALASYVLGGGELLAQRRSGTTSYYLHDGQNNVRTLTDTNGSVLNQYVYDAYGATQSVSGTAVNSYQYTSQQYDSATGLYGLRARYYDAGVGRFESHDSFIGNETDTSQLNRYLYSADNPINRLDPNGHLAVEDVFVAIKTFVVSSFAKAASTITLIYLQFLTDLDELPPGPIRDLFCFFSGICPLTSISTNNSQQSNSTSRLPQDIYVEQNAPIPPVANNGNSIIGSTNNQTMELQADLQAAQQAGAQDIRVNQQQVDSSGTRVGLNRPDLNHLLGGSRYYIEYEQPSNPRGADHAARILANDPAAGSVIVKLVPLGSNYQPGSAVVLKYR